MKKVIFVSMLLTLSSMMVNCSSCQHKKEKQNEQSKVTEAIVENIISVDKEYMFVTYGSDYVWYETIINMKGWMDENPNDTIDSLCNVFQAINDGQPEVVFISHADSNQWINIKDGFWIEDYDMSSDSIKVTYKEAYAKAMEANCPKPHSKNCILRKPMGPKDCNAQWVFGNIDGQIWVDAVTGNVQDTNPAF